MVLYETLEAGLRAKALMDCVESEMDVPVQFHLECWRFDWLKERSLRNHAFSSARGSEVVIVSTSGASGLPAEVEQWLDAWAHKPTNRCSALIALHPKQQDGLANYGLVDDQLQRAARQKGVGFFCEFFEPAGWGVTPGANLGTNKKNRSPPKSGLSTRLTPVGPGRLSARAWQEGKLPSHEIAN